MEYNERINGQTMEVALSGRFTFADNKDFRALIAKIGESAIAQVRIDLSGLSFIDSAALGMLLLARETAGAKGKKLVLRGANDQVARVMKVAQFDKLFTLEA